ncbi:hypothetical protein [Arthrobacter sp. VKM Ac-2550]|uniref:hypothetical protein n=1 Tax=Crystallibacter permensis TaxID=1938888 RepID=UPI002227C9E8|nr:hypothetical protein [Arthrobacter sp. VKM Ac-2550]MCW2132903.1 hypothetical protein [Arthrobacter sp. VKM Ac-2550]
MSECTANGCGAATPDGIHLCPGDTLTLEYRLAEVTGVWADLVTTLERRDRAASSPGGGGNHAGSREPLNLDALDKAQAFRLFLRSWARRLNGIAPIGEPHVLAAWIMLPTQLQQITGWTDAGQLLDDLTAWLNKLRSATDRAAHKITLGDCWDEECPGILKAFEHATIGRCDTCGQEFDVKGQQVWMIKESWHVVAPLPLVLRALKESGHARIPLERAKKWVQRGKVPTMCHIATRTLGVTPAAVYDYYTETAAGKRIA